MMRPLPQPQSLREAVRAVIKSNVADGCYPKRFIQVTKKGDAPDLVGTCEGLIAQADNLKWLETAVVVFPELLALEDLVARFGRSWGFQQETIAIAEARAQRFDELAGGQRYS